MKKTIYVLGSLEIIFGSLVLAAVDIMKASFPLLGRIAFQFAMKGSYSPTEYIFSAPISTMIALVLLCIGAGQLIIAFLLKEKK